MRNRNYLRIFQLVSFIILFVAFSIGGYAKPVHITILYSNDVHGHILPFDDTRSGKDIGGAARRSTLIQQIKKENPNTIVLDAGDLVSGTPISGIFRGDVDFGVLQLLGYDAMAIGNHDFDYSQEKLRNFIKTSKVPIISANIIETGKDKTLATPYIILQRGGLKIAVLGLTTPTTPTTTHPKNVIGLSFENPTITAAKFIPILKKKADIIIVLSHLGFQEDIEFGNSQSDVNIIVGGHSHTKVSQFHQDNENTPIIVQDFQWGINLGRLDFDFDKGKVINPKAELIPINSSIADDSVVTAYLKPYADKIITKMNEKVGETTVDLDKPSRSNPNSNLSLWMTEIFRKRVNADIAMQNVGGIRNSIPKGAITYNDIYNVLPFENVLVLLQADGSLMQEIVNDMQQHESSAVTGVTFRSENGKAVDILINGKALDTTKNYTIAVNDFMANGGSGYALLKKAKILKYDINLRDIVIDDLKKHPVISPTTENY